MRLFTDLILLIVIILNVLDFFQFLPGDIDVIKKVISWTVLALLFYRVHFTWIFFGNKRHDEKMNHLLDVGILFAYIALITKDVVAVALSLQEHALLFTPLLELVAQYAVPLQIYSFYVGGSLLILLSAILAFHTIQPRSLLGNLHLNDFPALVRFPLIFLILSAFFTLVFDLLHQWLAIAVDSFLIIAGIGVYTYLIVRRHKHFDAETLLHKIGSFGENFEERFIKFFHDKQHIFLGVTGLLVLHLVTEVANFFLPYLGVNNSFYFEVLGLEPLYVIFLQDILVSHWAWVVLAYALNIVAVLLLALLPAFIWMEVYQKKVIALPRWLLGVAFACFVLFIAAPLFSFVALENASLVGVNIIASPLASPALGWIVGAALITGIIAWLLPFQRIEYHVVVFGTLMFLAYYLFLFYSSTMTYFIATMSFLTQQEWWFLLFFITLFFAIKIVFYIFGLIKFVVQIARNHLL